MSRVSGQMEQPHAETGLSVAAVCRQFRVQFEYDNHLICRTWTNGVEGVSDVLVAKPWHLRRSSYDGTTYNGWLLTRTSVRTRQASKAGQPNASHSIWPGYMGGPIVYAVRPAGGTGVEGCAWVDVSNHHWAEVCE